MVGWICATSNELVTARAMLDEEHTSLPYNARDSNAYTLGRIAGHNVVVASLPPGYYGSTAAAVVVRDMLWSFPAIKFGLLVGIGGGFCSPTQDVRLGDVVVSVPSSTSPGVIQFDHGKLLSQGIFQRSGSLNKPPSTLLMAISRLQAEHEINGPEFGLYILEALRGNPSERRRFSSPGHDQDLLFTAAYTHPPAERDCSLCDRSQLILRPQRDSQTPEVHYGSIASGNMVIKDAITRDNISRELGVLCFEMEAAGIMDNFPCLVIRGIADYSDSHKNAKWQGYAALAAAAYAKELLSIVPGDVKTDIAAAEVLDPEYLGSFEGRRADLDPDTSDTISEASTLMGSLEPGVVDTAIKKVAEVLAADENVRVLCTAAVLRITPSMLQWNLVAALTVLSKTLKKLAQTPVERGMGWLLSRYKPLIATSITETICRQEHIAVSLGLSQEETLSILDGRLMEMLRDRFPTAQAPYPASNIGRAREENTTSNPEEVPTQDLENGLDPDTQEPPESAILDDLGQLDQILCKGPVFEGMYERLKMLLFPSVPQLIENVLSRHLTITTQASTVICVIKWELLQYVKYENLDVHDIEFVFTLNSEFDCACAIPLGDYMSAMWEKGKELLEAVKASVSAAFNNGTYRSHYFTHLSRCPTAAIRLL
jgi:nucleoside phosphorylase